MSSSDARPRLLGVSTAPFLREVVASVGRMSEETWFNRTHPCDAGREPSRRLDWIAMGTNLDPLLLAGTRLRCFCALDPSEFNSSDVTSRFNDPRCEITAHVSEKITHLMHPR